MTSFFVTRLRNFIITLAAAHIFLEYLLAVFPLFFHHALFVLPVHLFLIPSQLLVSESKLTVFLVDALNVHLLQMDTQQLLFQESVFFYAVLLVVVGLAEDLGADALAADETQQR